MTEKRSRITAFLSIAAIPVISITGCTDAEIHALLGEPSSDQVQQQPYTDPADHPADPLSRDAFGAMYRLGDGVDSRGYFQSPIDTEQAYGQRIESGTITHPAEWDPNDLKIRYHVEEGSITVMDYVYGEGK